MDAITAVTLFLAVLGIGLELLFVVWQPRHPVLRGAIGTLGILSILAAVIVFALFGPVQWQSPVVFRSPFKRPRALPTPSIATIQPNPKQSHVQGRITDIFVASTDQSERRPKDASGRELYGTLIYLLVTVVNTSEPPVTLGNWTLTVKTVGGPSYLGIWGHVARNQTMITPDGYKITFHDLLADKTATPIVKGDPKMGILPFLVEGLRPEQLALPGSHYILSFNDSLGREYLCDFEFREVGSPVRRKFPEGLRVDIVPPKR